MTTRTDKTEKTSEHFVVNANLGLNFYVIDPHWETNPGEGYWKCGVAECKKSGSMRPLAEAKAEGERHVESHTQLVVYKLEVFTAEAYRNDMMSVLSGLKSLEKKGRVSVRLRVNAKGEDDDRQVWESIR